MEMILVLGGISSFLYIKDYMRIQGEINENTETSSIENLNQNKIQQTFSKINFNLTGDGNDKSISVLQKENESLNEGNKKFSIVENNNIKLNKVSKANNIQEENRNLSNYGLLNTESNNDFTYRNKSFLSSERDIPDYSKLNNLKRKKKL